jgi:hypothetical protein
MFLEEYKLGIDDLHRDVGQKYLLCQARKAPSAALFIRLCSEFPKHEAGFLTATGEYYS